MEKIYVSDLENKGLDLLNNLIEFKVLYNSYSTEFSNYNQKIINKGFVRTNSRSLGRDSEILEVSYRAKYKHEIDDENLELQIKRLEEKFNIKISFTKN